MNCSHNNMTQLPLKLLPDTEQLILVGNHLEILDFVSKGFKHLKVIDLQRNNISHIGSQTLKSLLSLADNVVLLNNNLQKVSPAIQTNLATQIWLANNPYECNCDMMWMRDWLQNASNVKDKENVTCAGGKWNGKIH